MVRDGERIAIVSVAELELALEVGAPERVWRRACRERRAAGTVARPAERFDQAVPVEHGVDRALGRHAQVAVQPPDEQFADFARAPVGFFALEGDDQALDLARQLIGVAHRPARASLRASSPCSL